MIHWQLLVRIAVATLLGGAIGFERDRRGRPAGLRTHMIVAMASATFMTVSTDFIFHQHYADGQHIEVDVSRIAASIVTGIGFLGGGAIMRTGLNVLGLTTAAGLWLVGAIGMAAGSGMYVEAAFVTALGLVALTLLRRLEDKDDGHHVRHVRLEFAGAAPATDALARLAALGCEAETVEIERDVAADRMRVRLAVRVPQDRRAESVVDALAAGPGVRSVQLLPPPL